MSNATIDTAKEWLRNRMWAKLLLALLVVLSFPVWFPLFLVAMLVSIFVGGAYDQIDKWVNNR